jgi:hypothetical protein
MSLLSAWPAPHTRGFLRRVADSGRITALGGNPYGCKRQFKIALQYDEGSKAYVYETQRVLGSLYVVGDLE